MYSPYTSSIYCTAGNFGGVWFLWMVDLCHFAGLIFTDLHTHTHYDWAYFILQLGDNPQNPQKLDPLKISHYTLPLCPGSLHFHSAAAQSVLLRTVPDLLTCARLTSTYCACLWSIFSACTVTWSHSGHIQAMATRPHGCDNWARFCLVASSNMVPAWGNFAVYRMKSKG